MRAKSKLVSSAKSARRKQPAPNKLLQKNKWILVFCALIIVIIYALAAFKILPLARINHTNKFAAVVKKTVPAPSPAPTPTPSPKPLTFAEMNDLYGPCIHLPVLMYHHIQSQDAAKADGQTALTVYTNIFSQQMQYLKSKGYNTATMQDLVNFFDAGTPIAPHSVLLTFDDGYQDFYTDAYPILSGLGFRATMFTISGLVNNPDYLTWDEILGMNGQILFANHTWSHKSLPSVSSSTQEYEISTADGQLSSRGLGNPKVFAYPYGGYTSFAANYLNGLGYQLAFTTIPGSVECKKQRFSLPRVRIGNASLASYGF